jgi:hypothetical protein
MLWYHYAYDIKIVENPMYQYGASITECWYQPNTCYDEKQFFCWKTYYFLQLVTSSVDCFASFHHSMLYLFWPIVFNFASLHQNMYHNPVSNFNDLKLIFEHQKLIFDFQAYGCYPYILDSLQLLYGNALQKSFKTL